MEINDKNLFFLTLPPPGSEGSQFNTLATNVHGVPIGETDGKTVLAVTLGYSDQDTIGSALDGVNELAAQLNIALADPKYASVDYVVVYMNQVDPKNPNLPPINNLLVLSKEMLKEGNIGGVHVNRRDGKPDDKPEITLGNAPVPTGDDVRANGDKLSGFIRDGIEVSRELNKDLVANVVITRPSGGNLWLSGNSYVAFLVAFSEMQRVLMHNKEVQGKIEAAATTMIYEMAKNTATLIMQIAKENQKIHLATAIMSGVSLGITAFAIGFTLGGRMDAQHLTTVSTVVSQLEKMVTSTYQAGADIPIARMEGQKEMIQAVRTILQRLMEKMGEAFRSDTEKIAQLLQLLDKLRDSLQQAIAASLRK